MRFMTEAQEIAADVIAAFNGLSNMARALGHKSVTTIDGWRRSKNGIPRWRRPEVIAAAAREGVDLPKKFVETAPPLSDAPAGGAGAAAE